MSRRRNSPGRHRQSPTRERIIGPDPGGGGSPPPSPGAGAGGDDSSGGGGGGGSPEPPESDYAQWVNILSCTIDKRTLDAGETTQANVRIQNVTDEERYRMSTVSIDLQLIAGGEVIGSVEDRLIGATSIATITFDVEAPPPGRYETEFRLTDVYAAAGR